MRPPPKGIHRNCHASQILLGSNSWPLKLLERCFCSGASMAKETERLSRKSVAQSRLSRLTTGPLVHLGSEATPGPRPRRPGLRCPFCRGDCWRASQCFAAFVFRFWFLALFCYILLYSAIFCYILLYSALFCSILLYSALFCSILLYSALFCYILLYSAIFCYILLYSAIFCYILLYSAIFCYILLIRCLSWCLSLFGFSIHFYLSPGSERGG